MGDRAVAGFGNALFGCAAWSWLLGRYPASRTAPLGLMVPVFGLGASAWDHRTQYAASRRRGWS